MIVAGSVSPPSDIDTSAAATAAACANLLLEPTTNVSKVYLEAEPSAAEVT